MRLISLIAITALGFFYAISPLMAAEKEQMRKLVIVTSYPRGLTDIFRREFEKKHPDIEVEVIKKRTSSAIDYLESIKDENIADLFWASAPDAFAVLKSKQLLQAFSPDVQGIPKMVAGIPMNDIDGFYSGFALSGYGFMWNTHFLRSAQLPEPASWDDLTQPYYRGYIGMCSPAHSGTTHVIVESVLQLRGWQEGWDLLKGIGGNLKAITKKSADVPRGVVDGKFAVGLVIDYFSLAAQAHKHPVRFAYPEPPTLLPANIAMINNAPNRDAAIEFMHFLLSVDGQDLLLHKDIRRLPVRPDVYQAAHTRYPNPYEDEYLKNNQVIDISLSKQRYLLINALFDNLITHNLQALQQATAAIQRLELKLQKSSNVKARVLLTQAREQLAWLPITDVISTEADFSAQFVGRNPAEGEDASNQQALEKQWTKQAADAYQQALELAEQGLKLMK